MSEEENVLTGQTTAETPSADITGSDSKSPVDGSGSILVAVLVGLAIGMALMALFGRKGKANTAELEEVNERLEKSNKKLHGDVEHKQKVIVGKDTEMAALKSQVNQLEVARNSEDETATESLEAKNKHIEDLQKELEVQSGEANRANKAAGEQQARADSLAKQLKTASAKLSDVEVQDAVKLYKQVEKLKAFEKNATPTERKRIKNRIRKAAAE